MNSSRIGIRDKRRIFGAVLLLLLIAIISASQSNASTRAPDFFLYDDALAPGYNNFSWGTTLNFASTAQKHSGNFSIAVTHESAFTGMNIRSNTAFKSNDYAGLELWLHGGGSGGQVLDIVLKDQSDQDTTMTRTQPLSSGWQRVYIEFDSTPVPERVSGLMLVNVNPGAQPTYYVDDVKFTTNGTNATTINVYDEQLNAGLQNHSWGTTLDLLNVDDPHEGSYAIRANYSDQWTGLNLFAETPFGIAEHKRLVLWMRGSQGNESVRIYMEDLSGVDLDYVDFTLTSEWEEYDIPLNTLSSPNVMKNLIVMNSSPSARTIYLDNISLEPLDADNGSTPPPPPPAPTASYNLQIDLGEPTHSINDEIYGINFGDAELLADLNIGVRRWGGNAVTRYNWQLDVSHTASDYYFMNYPAATDESQLPRGSTADRFVQTDKDLGINTLMTIPTIGWTPKARQIDCAFSIVKYGQQESHEPYNPDCGNGIRPNGSYVTGNDPADTSVAIDEQFIQDWIIHLRSQFGSASSGGVRYYALDNEPFLWSHTHRDVRPEPVGYDELRDRGYAYGAAIKEADPSAKVFGPVLWGYTAFHYSGIDAASGNWENPPDRLAHGDVPVVEWYLDQMRRYEQQHNQRILDYLDLHFYPQQANVALQPAGDLATQRLRLRSTRTLWDPTYVDESWIGDEEDPTVELIPQMHDWVESNYQGTKLALTEYNFGGLEHINGALAQADVLGIFGRERLDFATLWDPPKSNQPGAYAFRMYRNYDGEGSTFGDDALSAESSNQAKLAVYAARRSSDGNVTVMIINKSMAAVQGNLSFDNYIGGLTPANVYQYSGDDIKRIHDMGAAVIGPNGKLTYNFRADSITLLVFEDHTATDIHYLLLPAILKNSVPADLNR